MNKNISIKKYSAEDKKILVKLMEELQDFLVQIDPLKILRRMPEYGEEYTKGLLKKVEKLNGAIFVANFGKNPAGLVLGIIETKDKNDLLDSVPTKVGRILELIVSEKYRGKKIGSVLMSRIEDYFRQQDCDVIRLEVFEPNHSARNFYKHQEYEERVIDLIKVIKNR